MIKWTQIGEWRVKLELEQLANGLWEWRFLVVDGPSGMNQGEPVASDTLAVEQASAAAAQAIGIQRGPESSETQFDSSL
jgi:hypothetical protein